MRKSAAAFVLSSRIGRQHRGHCHRRVGEGPIRAHAQPPVEGKLVGVVKDWIWGNDCRSRSLGPSSSAGSSTSSGAELTCRLGIQGESGDGQQAFFESSESCGLPKTIRVAGSSLFLGIIHQQPQVRRKSNQRFANTGTRWGPSRWNRDSPGNAFERNRPLEDRSQGCGPAVPQSSA